MSKTVKRFFILSTVLLSVVNSYGNGVIIIPDSIAYNDKGFAERYFFWDDIDSVWIEMDAWADKQRTPFWDGGIFFIPTMEFMFNNFDAFESVLGKHNTDFLNVAAGFMITIGLSGTRGEHSAGFNFGIVPLTAANQDSLEIRLNSIRFGINYGFNLINSRRFLVTPTAGIQWSRYRLINTAKDRTSLAQYMSNRDVDLRFNQMTASFVMRLSYKSYNTSIFANDFWTIGIYGGFIANLNTNPWISSTGRRLHNQHGINLWNYTFGLFLAYHF